MKYFYKHNDTLLDKTFYCLQRVNVPSGHTDVLKTSKGRPFWTLGRPLWTSSGRPKDVPFEVTLVRPFWTSADVYFGLGKDLLVGVF